MTAGHSAADPLQTAGSIWTNLTWLFDPIAPQGPTQYQINITGPSTLVGAADYVYTRNEITCQHAIIELSFDTSPFVGQTIDFVRWRPACGNDELDVELHEYVPEPTALVLFAGGSVVLMRRRR